MLRSITAVFGGLKLRPKLVLGFLALSLLIAVCGASGLFFVKRIGASVSVFADVTSPMLGHTLQLVDNAQRMRAAFLEATTRARADDDFKKVLAELDAAARRDIDGLRRLASEAGLTVDVNGIERRQRELSENLQARRAAHSREQTSAAKTIRSVGAVQGRAGRLRCHAHLHRRRSGNQDVEAEDRAKIEVQTGAATVEGLGELIARALNETYPLLQGLNRMMRDVVKLQETTTAYVATTESGDLDAIQKRAQTILKTANAAVKRMASRLRTDEGKKRIAQVTAGLDKLEQLLTADAGVFAAHRDLLAAKATVARLQHESAAIEAAYSGSLEEARRTVEGRNEVAKASAAQAVTQALTVIVAIILGGLLLSLTLGLVFASATVNPLQRLTRAMTELANGSIDITVPERHRRDEIGDMAAALQVFKDHAVALKTAEEQAAEQQRVADETRARNEQERAAAAQQVAAVVDALGNGLDRLARGDLSDRLNGQFAREYKKVQEDFNAAIAQLQETIRAIVSSTHEVSGVAAQISTSTTNLSERTEQQAASLEQTTAAMEQIAATVKENAESARHAKESATGTRAVADRGGEVISEAVQAMGRIAESSHKIADIIGVIDEIARQTNLLALNAAVEAARAGEAGRGFAVVASEVRSLAQRSSQAANDIKDLIMKSSGQVKDGVDLVNRAGDSLQEIVKSIDRVVTIVAEIASASTEQASGIEQVAKALAQMDEVTQHNSSLVEESAATAKTLENESLAMTDRVGFFQLGNVVALRNEPSPKYASAG